jgi:adenylate cyclase
LAAYWNYRRLSWQRERIQTALGYYVPAPVLGRLVQETVEQGARRELVYGTCLVSDAERFTSLSEQLRADDLGELMEAYYRALSTVIERHSGFVADISGDSIVAVWTEVRSQAEAKQRACAAALEMRGAVDAFNVAHAPHRLPTGFGLDSGEVLVGNINIAQRYQYRAIGDIVNTASRVQGLNRLLGTQVLASAATLAFTDAPAARRLGRFLLMGKATTIDVYEIRDAGEGTQAWAKRFEDGLVAFSEGYWDEAHTLFEDALAEHPGDGPTRFYLEQCARRAGAPVPPDWSGTITMTVK